MVEAGGRAVASLDDLLLVLGRHPVGTPLTVQVVRNGEAVTLEAHPTDHPEG